MKRIIALTLTFLLMTSMSIVSVYAAEETTANPIIARYYVDEHIPVGTTITDKKQIDSIDDLATAGKGWDGTWYKDWGTTPVSGTNFHLRTSGGTNDTTGIYFGLGATTQYARKLASPINATADGVYYARATMVNKQASAHATYDVKSYFSLADSGNTTNKELVKVSIDYLKGATAPTMTVNDVPTNAVLTANYSYDILIKLNIDADGMDKLSVEWVGKDEGFTGNWNYETQLDLGENTIDFVSFGNSGLATMRFKNVEIEAYNDATTLLDKAKQAEALIQNANKSNFRSLSAQVDTLLADGKHKDIVKYQIMQTSGVKAYDYLEFENVADRTELKSNATLRQGGSGWKSDWSHQTTSDNNTFTSANRQIRKSDDKYYINITTNAGYVRRWFADSIDTSKDGRYMFDFTLRANGSSIINSSGACFNAEYSIGASDTYNTANTKVYAGMMAYAEGTHPVNPELPAGVYPYIKVGNTTKVGTKYMSYDGSASYKYSVEVNVDADDKETFRLQVAHYETNLKNNVCDLKITEEEIGNVNLSWINLKNYVYGIGWYGDFVIYEKKNILDAENVSFWLEDEQITTKENLTDTLTVKTSIDNTFDQNKDVTLYVAIYKGDQMLKASAQPVTALANQITPVTLYFTAPEGVELSKCEIKAFVWDGELKPLIVGVGL